MDLTFINSKGLLHIRDVYIDHSCLGMLTPVLFHCYVHDTCSSNATQSRETELIFLNYRIDENNEQNNNKIREINVKYL